MSLAAVSYRDDSRTPLAFTLSAMLHVLLAVTLAAVFLLHPSMPPAEVPHVFTMVAGPRSDSVSDGPTQSLQPFISPSPAVNPTPTPTPAVTQPEAEVSPSPAPTNRQTTIPQTSNPLPNPHGTGPRATQSPKVMTAAEWQKLHGITPASTASNRSSSVRSTGVATPHVDVSGIVQNLGNAANRAGNSSRAGTSSLPLMGADGTSDDYWSRVAEQIRTVFVPPTGIDGLVATIRLTVDADGTVLFARITKPSPDDRFNAAVNAALARLKNVGPPPGGKQVSQEFYFNPTG